MTWKSSAFLILGLAMVWLAGCATRHDMKSDRAQLIAELEREMTINTQWLRIHAAEGLLDNGESREKVTRLFRTESETATAPYRIGVWRVLARATEGEERRRNVELIRSALNDPQATDRISAAESLGKLNAVSREDRTIILQWLKTADDATAAFPRWLLVLSSASSERHQDEQALTALVSSTVPVARIRAAFALGRLKNPSPDSIEKIQEQLRVEPSDSIARIYLITALLLHETNSSEITALEKQLLNYSNGKPNEQLELGIVTGLRGNAAAIPVLESLLQSSEPDARIGAANGLLKLLK
jgi:HEAT repeat protein